MTQRWDGYDVRFPHFQRSLAAPYAVVSSAAQAKTLTRAFSQRADCELRCGESVIEVSAHRLVVAGGTVRRGDGK